MKKYKGKSKKIVLIACLTVLFLFLTCFLVISISFNKYKLDITKLTSINNGIAVYAATDNIKDGTLHNSNRSIIEIESLPKYVLDAFIVTEDKRFYSHNGFDIKRIAKACVINAVNKTKEQGASTISQQLIKNALLSNEKTYSRKLKEVVLAVKMEKKFTKNEILEMYLNTIYFGSNSYGIENASKTYFNKSAKDLTLNEACCLAGIIKSPSYYSPKTNIENCNKRKNLVAKLMLDENKINNEEYLTIINSDIQITTNSTLDNSYEEEAIYEACKLLNITERELINNEYKIITFKNQSLQNEIININKNVLSDSGSNLDSLSIVTNNKGQILAYHANSNYDLHNLTRQPASTLKPLAVYLPCLTHNILTSASHILDEEINYNGYSPKNADNSFHGYVTAEYALANSLNIPAVKLLDCVGLKKSKDTLNNLGINISNKDLNLSLALGCTSKGIKILDLLSAYNTLSNLGKYRQLCFVNKILDKNNNVIYEYQDYSEQVVEAESCYILNDMLKETSVSGTSKRFNSLGFPVCSKTGTASGQNGNTDLYNFAYTSEYSMVSWVADLKNTYLNPNIKSSVVPTEINKQVLKYIYSNKNPTDFTKPENVLLLPYNMIELEKNHKIIAPTQNEKERFIDYAYFKKGTEPQIQEENQSLAIDYNLSSVGFSIQFSAQRNKEYIVYKIVDGKKAVLKEIFNSNSLETIVDYNVFKFDEISYYIEDKTNNIVSETVKIKPKEYLINQLNKELLSNKKKWYV